MHEIFAHLEGGTFLFDFLSHSASEIIRARGKKRNFTDPYVPSLKDSCALKRHTRVLKRALRFTMASGQRHQCFLPPHLPSGAAGFSKSAPSYFRKWEGAPPIHFWEKYWWDFFENVCSSGFGSFLGVFWTCNRTQNPTPSSWAPKAIFSWVRAQKQGIRVRSFDIMFALMYDNSFRTIYVFSLRITSQKVEAVSAREAFWRAYLGEARKNKVFVLYYVRFRCWTTSRVSLTVRNMHMLGRTEGCQRRNLDDFGCLFALDNVQSYISFT